MCMLLNQQQFPCALQSNTKLVPSAFFFLDKAAEILGSVAAAQKSCRDWIKQTNFFIVDLFYFFVSMVSCSIVLIQLD